MEMVFIGLFISMVVLFSFQASLNFHDNRIPKLLCGFTLKTSTVKDPNKQLGRFNAKNNTTYHPELATIRTQSPTPIHPDPIPPQEQPPEIISPEQVPPAVIPPQVIPPERISPERDPARPLHKKQ
ncbi:hypothetical protein [Nitrosomonas supralitoralis]|uniref:Uncharacterized protein n=1 Tax=Nitrosomonas supralitoralis TaxID=2116706 RepID=A0A2P7NT86_9PROT|nr:hypothetical protein [Nitrosomonas supralitoralis]PSJ16655.1 hypothetical protein C7H79_12170 [Nitrosomonas supralitoralis]